MTHDQFLKQIESGPLKPAYIVAGNDTLAVEESVRLIQEKALEGADPTGVVSWFDGREVEPATVLDGLRTRALWGPRRVIVVETAGEFLKRAGDAVASCLAGPTPAGVLVLVARGESAPATAFKKYAKVATVVACAAPRRVGDRVRWLVQRAASRDKRLIGPDARLLLDLVAGDLSGLDAEIEKLATYVGSRKSIRRADIEALVAPSRVEPVYQLGDAVTAGDLPRALRLAEDLLAEGVELPFILGTLRSHLRRFWQVKRQREAGRSPAEAARAIGEARRAWLIEKLYRQVDAFSDRQLGRCFDELLKADLATKTGAMPNAVALERFVVAACGRA